LYKATALVWGVRGRPTHHAGAHEILGTLKHPHFRTRVPSSFDRRCRHEVFDWAAHEVDRHLLPDPQEADVDLGALCAQEHRRHGRDGHANHRLAVNLEYCVREL